MKRLIDNILWIIFYCLVGGVFIFCVFGCLKAPSERQEEVFKIGQFAKPHGIKGELSLLTQCDLFEETDDPYIVCEMDGILVPFFVEEYRYKSESVLLLTLAR